MSKMAGRSSGAPGDLGSKRHRGGEERPAALSTSQSNGVIAWSEPLPHTHKADVEPAHKEDGALNGVVV